MDITLRIYNITDIIMTDTTTTVEGGEPVAHAVEETPVTNTEEPTTPE